MDGRGGGDNRSVTSIVKRMSSRQDGMERCGQSRHQGTSASRLPIKQSDKVNLICVTNTKVVKNWY